MFSQIFDAIEEWMRGLLTGMINSNLDRMFTDVNQKTGEIASQVGQTPQGWNSSIFSMIENLSNSVIMPIAGIIITFLLCYELITMLTERNNMYEKDGMHLEDVLMHMINVKMIRPSVRKYETENYYESDPDQKNQIRDQRKPKGGKTVAKKEK